jgi:hypothetical protein
MVTKNKRSAIRLETLAEEALKEAVAEVIAEHKFAGYPLAVWRDGRAVHLSPEQIEIREPALKYKISSKKEK